MISLRRAGCFVDTNLLKLPFHAYNALFVRGSPLSTRLKTFQSAMSNFGSTRLFPQQAHQYRCLENSPIDSEIPLRDPLFGRASKVKITSSTRTNAKQIIFLTFSQNSSSSMHLRVNPSYCTLRHTAWPRWKKQN